MLDVDALADVLVLGAKQYIDGALAPIVARLHALESRPAATEVVLGFAGAIRNQDGHLVVSLTNGHLVDVGPVNGRDGAAPAAAEIEAMVSAAVVAEVAKIEPAQPGRDADAAEVAAIILPGLETSLRDFAALTIAALPKAENGRDADPDDMTRAVAAEVARQMAEIGLPRNSEPAEEVVRAIVVQEVARIIPAPTDKGVDAADVAAVIKSDLEPALRDLARELVAALPPSKDGESADPAETERMVAAEVQRHMALLSPGIEQSVAEIVERAVAALPKAEDGHTPTEADIQPLVAAEVADAVTRAVAALPKAADGHTPTEAEIQPLVATAVADAVTLAIAALPKAEDGHTPTEAEIQPLVAVAVADAVTRAVAALPKAADGHTPTEDDLLPMVARVVAEEVMQAVAAVPKAKDGEDAKPEVIALAVADEVARVVPDLVADGLQRAVAALPKPADGRTPTEDDIQPLVARTVDAVFAATPRPRDGEPGKRGASVMDAAIDADGQMVLRMSDGRNVVVQGRARGEPGKPGEKAKAGAPGRDAIEITIRPGIDDTRSYPPGTYAAWGGGVIGAVRQTDPIVDGDIVAAGWFVAQCGIAEETIRESNDGRVVERVTRYTDGRTFTHRSTTATPIYRGIWKEGRYERGDMVTRGGSVWHCEKATGEAPGDGVPAWVLSVKRGRDAKEPVKRDLPPPGPVKL